MATPKILLYEVELRAVRLKRNLSRPVVYTNDLNSAEFQFKITDMDATELLTATAKTMLYMRDGSFFQNPSTDVSRVGNVFSYLLKENEGNHAGIAKIQLVVYFNEGLANEQNFPTQLYEFEIINGLETKVAQEVMIYDWTTLTRDARAYIDQFVADELLRDAEFDNAQFDRNTAFVASQDARTLAFGTEQTNRGTAFTAEQNERTTAFNESESGRTTAETGRVTAEEGRVTAEDDRVTKEGQRVTAETNRVTAEDNRVAAESGRVTAESARATTFAGYDARIVDMEADVNADATNIVINGDFSVDTNADGVADNWTSISGPVCTLANGEQTIESVDGLGNKRIEQNFASVIGHKYYSVVEAKMISGGYGSIKMYVGGVQYLTISGASYYKYSQVLTSTISTGAVLQLSVVGGVGKIAVKNALVIDLTTTFGAGNEPTATQMDRLLTQFPNSWFNGTENLFLAKWALNELRRLDSEKANKVQEAWITPTLLNGATGLTQYRKNQFGIVECYGQVVIGTGANGTDIFKLPSGYMPGSYIPSFGAKIIDTGALANIYITGDGTVKLGATLTTGHRLAFYITFYPMA